LGLEQVAALPQPTLLIYGSADGIVPAAQAQALAAKIAGARLVTVPGGTHLTTPFEPGVLPAITAFLAEARA
jgi:pimeloyl-ACP methyl ester carboxylesterase